MVSAYIYICSQLISFLIFICHHCDSLFFSIFFLVPLSLYTSGSKIIFLPCFFYLPFFVCVDLGIEMNGKKVNRKKQNNIEAIIAVVRLSNFFQWKIIWIFCYRPPSPNVLSFEFGTCECFVSLFVVGFRGAVCHIWKLPFHSFSFQFLFRAGCLLPFLSPSKASNRTHMTKKIPSSWLFSKRNPSIRMREWAR